jgi:hypothetical protein
MYLTPAEASINLTPSVARPVPQTDRQQASNFIGF